MVNILFLCTGNSCRSQIAEGWTRQLGEERIAAQSAGIQAHGHIARAISITREAGIDISSQESTVVNDEMLSLADVVVTVCGHADEHCPVLPTGTKKEHWPLEDPAKAEGSEEEIMNQFRASRDDIEARVKELLQRLIKTKSI